jgi:hypothetical protein
VTRTISLLLKEPQMVIESEYLISYVIDQCLTVGEIGGDETRMIDLIVFNVLILCFVFLLNDFIWFSSQSSWTHVQCCHIYELWVTVSDRNRVFAFVTRGTLLILRDFFQYANEPNVTWAYIWRIWWVWHSEKTVLPEFRHDFWSMMEHWIVDVHPKSWPWLPAFKNSYIFFSKSANPLWTKDSWLYFLAIGMISSSISFFAAENSITIKWSQKRSTPHDGDTSSNRLKKFSGGSIVFGNLIVNYQNFYSIYHLISLHLGSFAVFSVVWDQSNYWSVPCLSSLTPPWGPGWVYTVTMILKSSIVDDTWWTRIPFCLSLHLLINKLSQPPYRSIGSETDLNGSSWRSTYSFWLPQCERGLLITRDYFGR